MANLGHLYVTQTGMAINSVRAAFVKIPGVDVVFKPFNVRAYRKLQDALAQGLVDADTNLMLFEAGGQSVTLLQTQMAYHHVAQGQLNGEPWAAFLCVCCNMGTTVTPIINEQVHHFRVTGIYNSMSIMSDDESKSVWEHITGECIKGRLQGTQLETRPAQYLTAAQVLEMVPDALIAISTPLLLARLSHFLLLRHMLNPNGYIPGLFRLSMTQKDERLAELELGLGVWMDGQACFYPIEFIRANDNAILDTLNQQQILVYIDSATQVPTAHISVSQIQGWENDMLVLESGERVHNGYVLHGDSKKTPIERPNQQFTRWYGFSYMFPNCEIYIGAMRRGDVPALPCSR
jgi:Protein of unknown function (DUF3179)